jgi:uncharacterized membrane protein
MNRITTIDVTRGLVMVIMALDHVRDFFHTGGFTQDPTNLATTTPELFLTRWITHLCAPTFVFLSGTSAYLSLRKRNDASARRFMLKRGLVLILLELTIVNFGIWLDIHFHTLILQVIYTIGGGFILLSVLTRLPLKWLAVIGLVIVFGHNLLQQVPAFTDPGTRLVWSLLFRPDFFSVSPSFAVLINYPVIPWLGIMLTGFAAGSLLERPISQRKPLLLRIGIGSLALFVLLRFLNSYGDPAPWAVQKSSLFTFLSFINVSKYPPSLLYALLMLGLMFLILAAADGVNNSFTRWLTIYGKVPMFYYIVHWYLVHLSMLVMSFLQGYSWADIPSGPMNLGRPEGAGLSLGWVYVVWLCIVIVLYRPCKWYGRYKAAHAEVGWLRYV